MEYTYEVTMRVVFDNEDDEINLLNALGELEDEGYFPTGAEIKTNWKPR